MVVVPSVLFLLILEKKPAVQETEIINTERAALAKNLAKRTLRGIIRQDHASISISASEEDLNSLMAVAARGIKRLEGRVNITQSGLYAAMTYHLPHNPVGDFINVRVGVFPSDPGLHLSQVAIGKIKISDRLALFLFRLVLDIVLGNENGTVWTGSVQSVNFRRDTVTLNLQRIPDLIERREKIVKRFQSLREFFPPLSDPEAIRLYYAELLTLEDRVRSGPPVSLAYFIGPLFQLARQRSLESEPAEENKAALLALATFAGDRGFERFIGPVHPEGVKYRRTVLRRALLGGREDLRLHFVISAGLKIITDSGITYAIGEFKEMLDSNRGGSGFSFIDLAADLSGMRLAEVATDRTGGARKIQSMLDGEISEDTFFPAINDLPEDLTKTEFERIYVNVENPKYVNIVNVINDRISHLPIYQ